MQIGLNTDIVHQGKTLHIQTEDIGATQHYIITHLFLAGSIIDSQRHHYEEDLSKEEIKSLIQLQHQTMIRTLLSGHYNRKILLHRSRAQPTRNLPLACKSPETASNEQVTHKKQLDPKDQA